MKRFLKNPARYLPISGFGLDLVKLIAAAFMVVDHMSHIGVVSPDWKIYIGRAVYPLFAYAVACHFLSGRIDLSKHSLRLMAFGVLAQPFYFILVYNPENPVLNLNILFTIMASLFVFRILQFIGDWRAHVLIIGVIILGPLNIGVEYGLAGIILPTTMYMALRGQITGYIYFAATLLMLNAGMDDIYTYDWWRSIFVISLYAFSVFASVILVARELASLSKKDMRFLPRLFLYWFYPVHFILIIGLAVWLEQGL